MARDYEHCLSSLCHHVSNDEYYGKPFLLSDFQRENMWKPLFACGHVKDGSFQRQYRRAIFGLPSGYGKSEIATATLITVSVMEPIYNGQYGLVASSTDQVRNDQEKIATMIKLSPILKPQWDLGKDVFTHKETGAKIMVFPNKADALESWHLNVVIFDELHVYRDSKVWDAGLKGQKVLKNPLAIGITTAGDQREGFLWDTLQSADKDKGLYLYWLGLDDKDSINSKKAWQKLMVAPWVTWESIQDQRNSATSARAFERYAANRFPSNKNSSSCFTSSQLDRCSRGSNEFDFNEPFTLGIDGATSGDSYAIVAYQERISPRGVVHGLTKEWVFDEPGENGYYNTTEIGELIAYIWQNYHPRIVGIDPNRMIVLANQLKDTFGVELVSFAQSNAVMCQATSLVINSVKEGHLKLKGCPKLKNHLSNCVKEDKGAYGERFSKDNKKSKIDAAIALSIAMLAYDSQVKGTENFVPVF